MDSPLILLVIEKVKGNLSQFPFKKNTVIVSIEEAVEFLKTNTPDVVIMELKPINNHPGCIYAIRKQYQGILIVILGPEDINVNIPKFEIDDFILSKNLTPEKITKIITDAATKRDFRRILNGMKQIINT